MSCAPACWRLAAAIPMATTSTGCASIRPSSSPADACPTPAGTSTPPRAPDRGDRQHGREEGMPWCECNGIDYVFGLPGNVVLDRLVEPVADDIRVRRALNQAEVLRGFAETRYAAKSWDKERRVVARIEACASHEEDMLRRGIDIRYVVTSLQGSDAEHIYETVYCAR